MDPTNQSPESETSTAPDQTNIRTAADIRKDAMVEAILTGLQEERTPDTEQSARDLADEIMRKHKDAADQIEAASGDLAEQLGMDKDQLYWTIIGQVEQYYADVQRDIEKRNPEATWLPAHKKR